MSDDAEVDNMDMGSVITDRLAEGVKNMDILNTLQKMVASDANDEESLMIKQKLQSVIDKYKEMSGEEQMMFQNQVKETLKSKLSMQLKDKMGDITAQFQNIIIYKLAMIAFIVIIVITVVVFFGYKLYKSIKDKEIKKEEKKKQKQMKKKK